MDCLLSNSNQWEYIITPVVGAIVSYWLSSYLVKAYFKLSIENNNI